MISNRYRLFSAKGVGHCLKPTGFEQLNVFRAGPYLFENIDMPVELIFYPGECPTQDRSTLAQFLETPEGVDDRNV